MEIDFVAEDIARIEEQLQIESHKQGHPDGALCYTCKRQQEIDMCLHEDIETLIPAFGSLYRKKYLCNDCGHML